MFSEQCLSRDFHREHISTDSSQEAEESAERCSVEIDSFFAPRVSRKFSLVRTSRASQLTLAYVRVLIVVSMSGPFVSGSSAPSSAVTQDFLPMTEEQIQNAKPPTPGLESTCMNQC